METPTETFPIGTLVFAKMKGFPYWPAVVTTPTPALENMSAASNPAYLCVLFFGPRNFSWIHYNNLMMYDDKKDYFMKTNKSMAFQKACRDIEIFIQKGASLESLLNDDISRSARAFKQVDSFVPVLSRKRISVGRASEGAVRREAEVVPSPDSESDGELDSGSLDSEDASSDNSDSISPVRGLPIPGRAPWFDKIGNETEALADKTVEPSKLKFGFLGLGKMGQTLVKKLLDSKHNVTVWNRSVEKYEDVMKAGAGSALTPGDVLAESDVTFCCVSDPVAASELVFGNCGVLQEVGVGKGYVEISGIDPGCSVRIGEAVTGAGGRYLEVRLQGGRGEADAGTLQLLAAGDRSLYEDCASCFAAFSSEQKYFPEVGMASTYFLSIRAAFSSVLVGMSELLSMSQVFQMTREEMVEFIEDQRLVSNEVLKQCCVSLREETEDAEDLSLAHLRRDVAMFLREVDKKDQDCYLASHANERLKECIRSGQEEASVGAVFRPPKPTHQ